MRHNLEHRPGTKTVAELLGHYENGNLNLEPGFQRQSVWHERDRAKLIDSIIRNYPLPAIFLYRRQHDGQIIYDVIDGKQRLESIFMFMGKMRGRYQAKLHLPGEQDPEWLDWKRLCKRKMQHLLNAYEIPVIEVDGDIGDIIDVFVRINSTGKALTQQEKRHARYYNSYFLREAAKIASRFEKYFRTMGVVSVGQINRMKHVELVCELMLSIHQGDVINKKIALDRVMAADGLSRIDIRKASRKTVGALRRLRNMFPKLYTTRLCQVTDFYTLIVLIAKFEGEGLILTDRKRNRLAWDLLCAFATRVDQIREKSRTGQGIKPGEELYREYLMTVSQMTDDQSQRQKREIIIRGILGSLFAKKDNQRGFSSEQRRILWNTTTSRRCSGKLCGGKLLSWDDFTIDHIDPFSKGGRSKLENAALMCRRCNSSKGNRKK